MKCSAFVTTVLLLLPSLSPFATALHGLNLEPPDCANACMLDSMFVTPCVDANCLCHESGYQKSLFQCLYAQCDSDAYGPALLHTIGVCVATGADIYMAAAAAGGAKAFLEGKEDDYLAGRLELRQESAGAGPFATTMTVTVTNGPAIVTGSLSVSGELGISQVSAEATATGGSLVPDGITQATASAEAITQASDSPDAVPSKPWVVSQSRASRHRPSYTALALFVAVMLGLDIYDNAF